MMERLPLGGLRTVFGAFLNGRRLWISVFSLLVLSLGPACTSSDSAGGSDKGSDAESNTGSVDLVEEVTLSFDATIPQLSWGAGRLGTTIESLGSSVTHLAAGEAADIRVMIDSLLSSVGEEGFQITTEGGAVTVLAKDAVGAMYGMLDVAEQLQMGTGLDGMADRTVDPRFAFRAIKFNLPWSSYRDGEALNLHTETLKDPAFWEAFLDMMAENRYNALTLWNLHPWPYLIKPTNFPLASPFSDREMAQWQRLWHTIFRMAQERSIKPYLVNWNIYVNESFRANYDTTAHTDEAFWGQGTLTEEVKQYNRESVTQVINEYPNLAGLGTSAGDRMEEMTPQQAQDWISEVYYGGMKDADRHVAFIHRAAFRGDHADVITRKTIEAAGITEPIWAELKFNWSHGLSTPKLVHIHGDGGPQEAVTYYDPPPTQYKIAWMIRNEDIFVLRWGQADFIRQHIKQNGQEYVGGYFFGSETYIPAVDYIHQAGHAHVDWTYEFQRKWLMFMEWGRLLYDPTTPDAVFENGFNQRYGAGVGPALFKAWETASIAPLRFASFAQSSWDYTMSSEAFMRGIDYSVEPWQPQFFGLDDLIAEVPFDDAYMGIREYVQAGSVASSAKVTPVALASELEHNAAEALTLISDLPAGPASLECEKYDIETWANYGLYFAKKIRAGVAKEQGNLSRSQSLMQEALTHWQEMIRINALHNNPSIPDMQNGSFSWADLLDQVRAEAN